MSFKIIVDRDLTDNVYLVKFSIPSADISAADKDLLEAFGEPTIQVGGSVVGPDNTVVLPSLFRKIYTGFPYSQSFDGDDYTDAEDLANTWAATILAAISAAIVALRANADTFTGQTVTTL